MLTKEEQDRIIKEVFQNRHMIAEQKKNQIHYGDVVLNRYQLNTKTAASKAEMSTANDDPKTLLAKLVINTTNLIDSHIDVHLPGIWDKTLQEMGVMYLLEDHNMKQRYIIAESVNDGLKAYTENLAWSELGYSYAGNTQALIFETKINADRNEFMFNQYRKGYVLNHSVGMRYVKLYLCINRDDADYTQEKDNWDKYYPQVANKEVADGYGYFWAVTEAKLVEGSAVVKGSNPATPTLDVTEQDKGEAASSTPPTTEPPGSTPKTTISNYLF